MHCDSCGSTEIMATWPGQAGERTDLFMLIPERPAKGWCQMCWQNRYGPHPAPPRSGGKAKPKSFTKKC